MEGKSLTRAIDLASDVFTSGPMMGIDAVLTGHQQKNGRPAVLASRSP